ncbi:hypothetical protein PSEUBRA_000910 [Kalmanozyma brasiliensis GHG001]|uniref:Acyltransferase 3 domain-containing protein n=1 Tax=Kalmanozyma brasiliensis (strain GHG001) TaxID=1365824 RepID=V5GTS8_KALBG|nr:uncharacterized protein PSEUBRA_000910 [Kalmanozyma brasiliensis GHG001]EST09317.1 hypothetical protein PSEUBRA_000910 [Kalmanozyma brasiliensis GHG001]
MASRYSLSAELPATRKSLQRNRHTQLSVHRGSQDDVPPVPELPQQPTPATPADEKKIDVVPHEAWAGPAAASAPATVKDQDTVRRDLSLRPGATRAASDKKAEIPTSAVPSEAIYDDRGYLTLKPADTFGLTITAFSQDKSNDEGRPRSRRVAYLEGLRGILGLQVLIWTFFRIFAPAIVADRDLDGVYPATFLERAPAWQTVLRKVLSPLLFDGELQAAFFILLSGRTNMQTFIERRQALSLAGTAFKRPFRFIPPMAATLALVSLVIFVNGFRYAPDLANALNNQLAQPPRQWFSPLEYFISLLFFFSTPFYFKTNRAVSFIPPAGTLWIIPVIFQQTYVLIVLAFTLPYTVMRYKNMGFILLILTTAWVGRFSWYTLTGLIVAEWSVVYLQLLPRSTRGLKIPLNAQGSRFMPAWLPGVLLLGVGVMFKYLWISAFPSMAWNEYIAHVDGNTGKLNYGLNPAENAYPRYDNWLVATGALWLIEISPLAQKVLSNRVFVYTGRWAFSIALISGTVMLSLGSLLWHYLTVQQGWNNDAGVLAVLFVTVVPASLVVVEAYARVMDDGALWAAGWLWKWIRV